jgi:hypothetical protein
MKLMGIEFEQFACFDRQWIPLKPGVYVLVGRNNKGKTAILRGLGSLTLLPIPSSQPSKTAAQGYFRKPANYFDLNLVFALEDSDTIIPFVVANDDEWRGILATEKPLLKFRWRMRPASNMAYFLKCGIIVRERELELLAWDSHGNNSLSRQTYGYPGLEVAGTSLYAQSNSKAEDWIFNFAADALFAPQVPLKSVLYVDAHRTSTGNMNLMTVNDLASNANNLPGFLQTLQGRDPRKFNSIQEFFTSVFPEFEFINPESEDNNFDKVHTSRDRRENPSFTLRYRSRTGACSRNVCSFNSAQPRPS